MSQSEKTVKVSVRLPADTHRLVRIRALQEGKSLDALARGWFESYASGAKKVEAASAR